MPLLLLLLLQLSTLQAIAKSHEAVRAGVAPRKGDDINLSPKPVNHITPRSLCSGSVNLLGNSGVITVGGPDEQYENNMNCEWNIVTDPGTNITFSFTYFDVEHDPACRYDYVELMEGGSILGSRMCGVDLPGPITSTSNQVTVKFYSDFADPKKGFVLSYQANGESDGPAEQDVCGTDKVRLDYGESVVLYGNATSKAICKTLIKVPKGAEIGYDCPLFDLNKKGCHREKLKLESKWGKWGGDKQITSFCMTYAPDGVVFPSTRNNRVTYKRAKVRKYDETNGFRCIVYTV